MSRDVLQNTHQKTKPINLILYGPPGTGKTFATRKRAVELCVGRAIADDEEIKAEYARLFDSGQIRFTTFHQTMSYEDFVEGLRPVTEDCDDNRHAGFRLEAVDGMFTEIANAAENSRTPSTAKSPGESVSIEGKRIFKMSLGWAGKEEHLYRSCIDEEYIGLYWPEWADHDLSTLKGLSRPIFNKHWDIKAIGQKTYGGSISQFWTFINEMKVGDLVVVTEGNRRFRAIARIEGDYYYDPDSGDSFPHRRKVKWLVVYEEALPYSEIKGREFQQGACYELNLKDLKIDAMQRLLDEASPKAPDPAKLPNQFVLIIDEINRANISKTFGELITLMEPDKRLGQENELRLTLPYSGRQFGVPDNLHIIGTMNTADRSIALMDTALRRRFTFEEMEPQPDLLPHDVEGIDLSVVLNVMNKRIEYLYDREHRIGHAYFWNCTTRQDVDASMRQKVIPLLAEYFYEDWGRIASVLGDPRGKHFLDKQMLKPPPGIDEGESRTAWKVRDRFSNNAYDQCFDDARSASNDAS